MELLKKYDYRGFVITINKVASPFGCLYEGFDNIGEPVMNSIAYKTIDDAIAHAKNEIDIYIRESYEDDPGSSRLVGRRTIKSNRANRTARRDAHLNTN